MPEIEFHERKDLSVVAVVHIGGQVVCMSPEAWLETARDIVAQVEAHLIKRAADVLCTCGATPVVGGAEVCLFCGLPKVAHR